MSAFSLAHTSKGEELIAAWDARAKVVMAAAGDGTYEVASLDLLGILVKLMPLIAQLLTGGLTPAAVLALLTQALPIIFPKLDAGLLEILKQILAFFVKA